MRLTILTTLLMLSSIALNAQEKKFEHNIYVSGGLLIDKTSGDTEKGMSIKVGYGLNYYFSDKLSIMPGVALRQVVVQPFTSSEGGDDDVFTFLDVPIIMQYHFLEGNNAWVFGLGPVLSFCVNNDQYYYDARPYDSAFPSTDKIQNFNVGIQPSIMYQTGKFRIGVEGNAGLLNIAKQRPYSSDTKHIHDIVASIYYHF